jgi:acyl-CoA dehydrogenase
VVTLIWSLALVITLCTLAYFRFSLFSSTISITLLLIVGTELSIVGYISWIVFSVIAVVFNISWIRQQFISRVALKIYRSIMPEMSETEQTAIDAGTTWWEAELFSGSPHWKTLHEYPRPRLSTAEKEFIDGPVEKLCAMLNEFEITHQLADLPPDVWAFLKQEKFFAMIIKKEYGGLDFSPYAQSIVLQKLSGISSVAASTVGVPNSLGPGELLQHYGTKEQRDYYLPRLAKGEEIPCFALTSPEAGSDAGSIPDFGVICREKWEGKDTLGMKLTWNKRYITLAPVATLLGLAFKLRDPDGLIGDKVEIGITCALVPTDIKGVNIGRRHLPLNCMFQNGPTSGTEVFLPLTYIIGGQDMAGQGWRMLVECLSVGRGITLPSNSAGGLRAMALATGSYARIRRQFKIPIGSQEGIQEPLARIGANAYLMKSVNELTTTGLGLGEKPSVISAIVKYHLTHKLQSCLIDAMDIHGGKGICLGSNNYLGRAYQSAPIAVTVEGANILTRNMIIYGQGAIRCHPYVLDEMKSARLSNEKQALHSFDKALFGHVSFVINNLFRSLFLGLTGSKFTHAPFRDFTKPYYKQMNRLSSNLAFLSDTCMVLFGGALKRKEKTSARLGDILSYLYLCSGVLKHYNDDGRNEDSRPMVQYAIEDSLYKAQCSIVALLDNLPQRGMAWVLGKIIFPYGPPLKPPHDRLDKEISNILQTPCHSRTRLGEHVYLTPTPNNAIGLQEVALTSIINAETLFKKVAKASKERLQFRFLDDIAALGLKLEVLNKDEANMLIEAEKHRLNTINVDDFDPKSLQAQSTTKPKPKPKAKKTTSGKR